MRIRTTQRPRGTMPIGAMLMALLFFLPLGAWIVEQRVIEMGICGMRQALDIPCLSCGATRATLAALDGNLITALSLQPLVVSLYLIIGVWGVASFITFALDRKLVMDLNKTQDIVFKASLVVLPLLNWAYLIWQDV